MRPSPLDKPSDVTANKAAEPTSAGQTIPAKSVSLVDQLKQIVRIPPEYDNDQCYLERQTVLARSIPWIAGLIVLPFLIMASLPSCSVSEKAGTGSTVTPISTREVQLKGVEIVIPELEGETIAHSEVKSGVQPTVMTARPAQEKKSDSAPAPQKDNANKNVLTLGPSGYVADAYTQWEPKKLGSAKSQSAQLAFAGAAKPVRYYKVRAGDSLWKIARTHYGRGSDVDRIIKANKGLDARRLRIGQQIVIP